MTVVVRVEQGESEAETTSNIIGGTTDDGRKTGMQALLVAKAHTGVKPRIIGVPGHDTQAVTSKLVTIAQTLRAFAYASAYGCQTIPDVLDYRKNFSQRELMLIHPDFMSWDSVKNAEANAYAVARALGLRAKLTKKSAGIKPCQTSG